MRGLASLSAAASARCASCVVLSSSSPSGSSLTLAASPLPEQDRLESSEPIPCVASCSPPGLSLVPFAPSSAEQNRPRSSAPIRCVSSRSPPGLSSVLPDALHHEHFEGWRPTLQASKEHAPTCKPARGDCPPASPLRTQLEPTVKSAGSGGEGASPLPPEASPPSCAATAVPGFESEANRKKPELPASSSAPTASSLPAPGASASPVKAAELWEQFFSCVSRTDCALSTFFHSMRLLPGGEPGPTDQRESRKARRVWPMPLPYPSLLRGGAGHDRCPLRMGLNAVVLVLDWLYLGQPKLCPGSLDLGFGCLPSPSQWKAIFSLRPSIEVWNSHGVLGPSELGRSTPKFEGLERLLRACQDEWAKLPPDLPVSEAKLRFAMPTQALPVQPDRLTFVEKPSFDPGPYLDAANRRTYQDPLSHARSLAPEDAVPKVKVNATKRNVLRLLELLDSTGRLKLVRADRIRARLRCGVFALAKDGSRDRLILDARPPNLVEQTESRWVRSLGSLEQLQFLFLPPDLNLETYTEDLKEFYHSFIITEQRCLRNALAVDLAYEDVCHLACCASELKGHKIAPCLATMAMGDCNAVAFGQCSHLAVILRSSELRLRDFICLQGRPPRPGQIVAGLLIDDFLLLDPVPKIPKPFVEPRGAALARQVIAGYDKAGLPRNASKSVSRSLKGEFWGGVLDGVEGLLRPLPRRTVPLAAFLLRVVQGGITTVGMLEVLAGGLVSALQLRRRLLSLLEVIYSVQQHRARESFIPVRGSLAEELLCGAVLLSQADIDVRAEGAPLLLSTDASSHAEASVVAPVTTEFSVEISRHGLQRGLWNKLLSPLQALLYQRGEEDAEVGIPEELCYDSHPAWEGLCRTLQFRQLGPVKRVDKPRHINVGEVRAAISGEERLGRAHPGTRYLHLQDSQVSLACFTKGRSCSPAINAELRRSIPFHLSNRVRPSFGFIRSRFNPSDDPTRDIPVRSPDLPKPEWLIQGLEGDFTAFDAFLREHQLHPEQLAGLPDPAELLPEAPHDLRGSAELRAGRVARSPEDFAKRLLELPRISADEALALFRRLPKEVSARSGKARAGECSFSAGVFVHGGVVGLRRVCESFPASIRVLTKLVAQSHPSFVFSSISVNQNVLTLPHTDSNNLATEMNLVLPLTRFRGGELWIESEGGRDLLEVKGATRKGEAVRLQEGQKLFDPRRLHCTKEWRGTRTVLVAYTVRATEKLSAEQRKQAEALGFRLPSPESSGTLSGSDVPRALQPKPPGGSFSSPRMLKGPRIETSHPCVGSPRVEPAPLRSTAEPRSPGLKLPPLVLQCLLAMPPGRFVYSSVFPDLGSALRSGRGWLDLFSGSRGLGRCLASVAPWWILCLDSAHDQDENLLGTDLQETVLWLLRSGAFYGFSAGPSCGSFSAAAGAAYRSREFPEGRPNLPPNHFTKVQNDNDLSSFVLHLLEVCSEYGLLYAIENPRNSWYWKQKAWLDHPSRLEPWDFFCDMCVFGTAWKKATRLRTNSSLAGKWLLCGCRERHRTLRGRDKTTGVEWTRLSESYPRRFCTLVAETLVRDAGCLGDVRPLDIVGCAKCKGARFGEASHPGPRRQKLHRPPLALRDIQLVEPGTARIRTRVWDGFRVWLIRGAGDGAWDSVRALPELLVQMLIVYGQVLYSANASLNDYRQLLAHAQCAVPASRGLMRPAWDQITKWERVEPTTHRTPMPEPILLAMCAVALLWGWDLWAATSLLCFYGSLRIGEVLRAERRDFLTPEDLLCHSDRFFLCIREPKTRGRGARVQHSAIVFQGDLRRFFDSVWSGLQATDKLFPGSPWMYRKRWNKLLAALQVPSTFGLTPGCLRGGGAVAAYRRGDAVSEIQWRMRLQHLGTLAFYLQEVSAMSVIPRLPHRARETVSVAASFFPFLLLSRPAHTVPCP